MEHHRVNKCIPGSNLNLKLFVFGRDENRSTRRKAELRTNTNSTHMTLGPGIELETHQWEASTLITAQ